MSETIGRQLRSPELPQVQFTDRFWKARQEQVRRVMLPYQWQALNDAIPDVPKSYAIHNLRLAAGLEQGEYHGPVFQDSDLGKWLEAVGYTLATGPAPELEAAAETAIAILAKAQQPDGYLNSYFIVKEPAKRWTNLRDWHELYCAGHLLEGALAYSRATGRSQALEVMGRYLDLICRKFGPGPGQVPGYCGHEEIELALVKLYRATGERRYLEQARYFVEQRGQQPLFFLEEAQQRGEKPSHNYFRNQMDYFQAHLPVRQQTTADGHSVRACYLYTAMADVAMETGDASLLAACRTLWRNIVDCRMGLHGGIGASRFGERFTIDYDLPNEEVYAETCANIALFFFASRMLAAEPRGEYADIMERTLYNGIISGVSLDGTKFFYDNYLASYPGVHEFNQQKPPERAGWFGCSCCPPNLARLTAEFGRYLYSLAADGIYVHHYASSKARLEAAGRGVELTQETEYPWDERIVLNVAPDRPGEFTLALRVPGWCRQATLRVNGQRLDLPALTRDGYARVCRQWQAGDRVELNLAMPVERVYADPRVRQDAGRVALQRGPLVYCLEGVDNGSDLNTLVLPRTAVLTAELRPDLLGGVVTIRAEARRDLPGNAGLYRREPPASAPVPILAVPYFAWANRAPGEMLVWLRDGER